MVIDPRRDTVRVTTHIQQDSFFFEKTKPKQNKTKQKMK